MLKGLTPIRENDNRYVDEGHSEALEMPTGTLVKPDDCGLKTVFKKEISVRATPPKGEFLRVAPALTRFETRKSIAKSNFLLLPRERRTEDALFRTQLPQAKESKVIEDAVMAISEVRALQILEALRVAHLALTESEIPKNPFRKTDDLANIQELVRLAITADFHNAGYTIGKRIMSDDPKNLHGSHQFLYKSHLQSAHETKSDGKIDSDKLVHIQHLEYRGQIESAIRRLLTGELT